VYFPREEYEDRLSKLHQEMQRIGHSVAVIWQRTLLWFLKRLPDRLLQSCTPNNTSLDHDRGPSD
jgi:hypothetical protein